MVLVTRPKPPKLTVSKTVFNSGIGKKLFTCVEYSPSTEFLVTGGTDGLLRLWFPHKTTACEQKLEGHVKPITHIVFSPRDGIYVSFSEDNNARVWSDGWLCVQSIQVEDCGMSLIPTSFYYNTYNNELLVAKTKTVKCLGKGTDVFKNMLTSHDKPLCGALYHPIYKLVISVCQNGVATVWDVFKGNAIMEFNVTSGQQVEFLAMTFDGPMRKLLTICQDGKLRLWNFNIGLELAALPYSGPKDVTGIVCMNNRVFLSGRNSKIIFDLDIDESESRFLEHSYLDDISSMDMHETTLVTASSNGNIVIWDAETAETLYFLNTTESPKTRMAGKTDQGWAWTSATVPVGGTAETKSDQNISPLIVCLKNREGWTAISGFGHLQATVWVSLGKTYGRKQTSGLRRMLARIRKED
ncbi:WD repeat-containing protein on Y chromosome-like [Symphorus nematophorus]